jgi:hypothetical protein
MPLPFQEQRTQLKRDPARRFVSADEYCRLAVSRMPLVRRDEPDAAMLGLFDPDACVQYVTEEESLSDHFSAAAKAR